MNMVKFIILVEPVYKCINDYFNYKINEFVTHKELILPSFFHFMLWIPNLWTLLPWPMLFYYFDFAQLSILSTLLKSCGYLMVIHISKHLPSTDIIYVSHAFGGPNNFFWLTKFQLKCVLVPRLPFWYTVLNCITSCQKFGGS